jgi:hypothetical protein
MRQTLHLKKYKNDVAFEIKPGNHSLTVRYLKAYSSTSCAFGVTFRLLVLSYW